VSSSNRPETKSRLIIRPGTPEDAVDIACVHVDSWRDTYADILSESYLARLSVAERVRQRQVILAGLGQAKATFVVDDTQHGILGFADCGPARLPQSRPTGEFYAIYLLPEAQGLGVGRIMVASMAEHLHRHGMDRAVAWTLSDNRGACWFYERLGGTVVGDRPIVLVGRNYVEIGYGWDDLTALARHSAVR
jgi:ribosomal protein S18 acetylase RimI-like enzyme